MIEKMTEKRLRPVKIEENAANNDSENETVSVRKYQ